MRISTTATRSLMLASCIWLLSGCSSNSPLTALGESAAELAGHVLLNDAAMQQSRKPRAVDNPMVSTRSTSTGNPGNLYSGMVRTGSGGYAVLLTLLDGRFSHASYPDVACASNLKAVRSPSRDAMAFIEFVYQDGNKQCVASEQVMVVPRRDGGVVLRTITGGQITGEGILRPAVVPIPDALVGDWVAKIGGEYGGPRSALHVRLSQDGASFIRKEDRFCGGESRFAFMTSGSMHVTGYQEPTECDDGGMVHYKQINRNRIERTAYDPMGRKTSQVQLTRR